MVALDRWPGLMEGVARELLGEPNWQLSKPDKELRYGSNGSLSIDLIKGTYFDHEAGQGGGVFDLIERKTGMRGIDWISAHHPEVIEDRRQNGKQRTATPPLGKEVAYYDYVDEAGNPLSQKVRYEPKTFRMRHREGDRWMWGSKGIRMVPYCLPEMIEAIGGGAVIFVVEGEKDVDNLRKLGARATCNPGGAGKWTADGIDAFFTDADVVVIQDNDPQTRDSKTGTLRFHPDGRPVYPGQDHARAVCAALSAVARRVRLLDLTVDWPDVPKKGDVSDWIEHGGTIERLYEIAERAPDWSSDMPGPVAESGVRFKLIPFSALKASKASAYWVKGLIPSTGLVVVWGAPKCGKSFWTFDLVMHSALGRRYRGRRVKQCPVVYLALEGGTGFADRVDAWGQRYLADHRGDVPFYLLNVPVDLIADCTKLIEAIRAQHVKPGIVVIDTLNRALNGDENNPGDMARFIRAADAVRQAFNCAALVVHHCGYEGTRPRGHSSLHGAADAQIAVERDAADNVVARVESMRDGPAGAIIVSRLEQVDLGTDDDGDRIETLVIVPADGEATAANRSGVTGAARIALALLQDAIADAGKEAPASNHIPKGTRTIDVELWRQYCYAGTVTESTAPDAKQKAFVRACKKLQALGAIGIWNDHVWLAGQPGQGRTSQTLSGRH